MSKFIIQVAPLVPLPVLRTQVFSYLNSENLPIGTLVSVPFYFREIQGIVISSRKSSWEQRSPLKLKNIKTILEEKHISENQIKLAQKIAEYYFVPLGSVLKLMVPKVVKLREKNKVKPMRVVKAGKMLETSRDILKSGKKEFLLIGSGKQRGKIDVDLIRACLKENKQCLILVPEIFFSQNEHEKLSRIFSEEIALIHSRITKGQFYASWKRIKEGKTKIVIASKQGVFLPFSDLGLIIVQDEQDSSFKQWESMPRYNGARGAEFLAEISGAKIILESSAPSAERYHRAKKREFELIEIGTTKDILPQLEVVPLESGKQNPDFPVSGVLHSRLAEVLKNKKQAVIFMNRRGFSTRSVCENCKTILKCPKCDRALFFSEEQGNYQCLHCAYKMDIFSPCPSCGGFQFSHRGIGTQTVEKKIEMLFPAARIARLDADILRSSKKSADVLQKFSNGEIDILVGTQSVIKNIYSENTQLAASISGRDFTDGIEFNSRSLAVSRFFHMADLLGIGGFLTIQTFFGGNPLFDILGKYDWKKNLYKEFLIRKRFLYPPFRKFVKLVYRDKSEKKARSESKNTVDLLKATSDNNIEIIGPYDPITGQLGGFYKRIILIKLMPDTDIRELPIRAAVGALRKGWIVDVDPVSLFS